MVRVRMNPLGWLTGPFTPACGFARLEGVLLPLLMDVTVAPGPGSVCGRSDLGVNRGHLIARLTDLPSKIPNPKEK
jgi:hypothetical protein